MNLSFPAFAFNKDILLVMGLAFMLCGIIVMVKAWRGYKRSLAHKPMQPKALQLINFRFVLFPTSLNISGSAVKPSQPHKLFKLPRIALKD